MERIFQTYAVGLAGLLLAALAYASMALTGGDLFYSLDDPYIHLAVAETILDGGYGVNKGELSSPSSSIIFPLLLAVLLFAGMGTYAPIFLTAGAGLWSVWLISGLLWRHAVAGSRPAWQVLAFVLLPFALIAINAFALPFTGMEHSLHVLTVCFVVAGLVRLKRGQPVPMLLVAGLCVGPLLRFEALALSLAALPVLAWYGHRRIALVTAGFIAASVGGFVATMLALGLPPMPSSVMVKSNVSSAVVGSGVMGPIDALVTQFRTAVSNDRGVILGLAMMFVLLAFARRTKEDDKRGAVVFVTVAALGGHLFAGNYGWFSRYEIYAFVLGLLALVYLNGAGLRRAEDRLAVKFTGLLALLIWIAAPYAYHTARTPGAAENIYLQQYQMHRFATEFYPRPVAVNDIGYVSYQNPNYVLDLWGLASEETRTRMQSPDFGPDDIRELAETYGVDFAMIYDSFLGHVVPDEWCRIAELRTPQVSTASGEVAFYLVAREDEAAMRAALAAFADSLPAAAAFSTSACTAT